MIDNVYVFDDVLPKQYQDAIEEFLLGEIMIPWYLLNDVTYIGKTNQDANIDRKFPGLSHVFNSEDGYETEKASFLKPIVYAACEKIDFKISRILRTRAFLQLPTYYPSRTNNPHIDMKHEHLVCLYYVNDTQGPTVLYEQTLVDTPVASVGETDFKILRTVEPKKGRCLLFNGLHYHSSSSPETDNRCIINFDLI